MKHNILLIIPLAIITITSCINSDMQKNNSSNSEEKNSLKEKEKNTYDPGVQWKLVWSDEFDNATIDTNNWNFQVLNAGHFNEEWQRYTNSSENAYIDNNCLVIKAIHESDTHGIDQYTSARLNTANKQSWKYGKIVASIKLPEGEGIWPAFWMLGANIDETGGDTPWPQSGEVDILELYGSKNDSVIEANLHYADSSGSHAMMGVVPFKLKNSKFADSFHVFGIEWDTENIKWFVDGNEFASTSISSQDKSEFHKEFYILLNIAVGGAHAGRPDASTKFPQYMYVDWVRVYQK
ncbi:MAG: hypothetical protein C0598_05670 [Marinilabiliales bacterium]|nr:MAG: hypothetical protein C0598_05670 [Marinilabiliales bacterium]